jgi:hypothetical protein
MQTLSQVIKDERGSISFLTIILLFVFIGLMGIVIDLGHLHTVQNELRDAADACALRGARAFFPDDLTGMVTTAPDPANAQSQASLTIVENKSDNVALTDLPSAEMQVGIWDYTARVLSTWQWPPPASMWGLFIGPAISLPVKRDAAHNAGPVNTTMAQIFGVSTVPVRNSATAALSGVGGFYPGSPTLPFGTWNSLLTGTGQNIHGQFNNNNTDTLGWSNLDPNNTNPNANQIKKILNDPTGASTPDCPTGSMVGIQNGVASSCIQTMISPNNRFGLVETSPNVYTPNAAHAGDVFMMPVYDKGDNFTFNQSSVVGAVPVKIVSVSGPPANIINVQVVGGSWVAPGYGGGAWYGILAVTDPKLVQ